MHSALAQLDATALADLVRKKEVHPTELLEAAIARAESVNQELNAIVHPMYELARASAAAAIPDGPFSGVPFLLKDLLAMYAGVPMNGGCRALNGFVPKRDSELTARFKRAGLIIFGKTNTPELGILPTSESTLYGPAKNPWNVGHSTGGSSGGSAAAVAAGIVPMAHANDGGGSIRIPASCCGVFGMKPTRARNPLGPDIGDLMNGLVVEHAVTRSVRDSARLLDATQGPDAGPPYAAPTPVRPYAEEIQREPGKLRIAVTRQAPTGVAVHADVIAGVDSTVKLLEELGHEVVEDQPQIEGTELSQAFLTVWMAGTAEELANIAKVRGKEITQDEVEPTTWACAELGRAVPATQYMQMIAHLQMVGRTLGAFFEKYDSWLTPSLAEPPLPLGSFVAPEGMELQPIMRAAEYVPFTPLANATGVPAMSIPLFWNAAGLPIGSHFFGRYGDEATLFRLAAQLERARPWASRRPPVSAAR